MWSLSILQGPLPLVQPSSPELSSALETMALGNNLIPAPSAGPTEGQDIKLDQQLPKSSQSQSHFIILLTSGTSHFEIDLSRKLILLNNN